MTTRTAGSGTHHPTATTTSSSPATPRPDERSAGLTRALETLALAGPGTHLDCGDVRTQRTVLAALGSIAAHSERVLGHTRNPTHLRPGKKNP